ncbi:L-threonine 3-O-phosphate decarboxylase [Methylophaga lonarensis MPL]|uniref:threonine-phosphate decarboxylase n=1 Tax=Methylophaga lonarensis MPL TaxID=1286106 RepID=M7NYQ2_9GAMM|nr:threonine-phosphate decarboxylase CobD [Methylophaga lonarensis]EMR13968.1 L-threonine 3-O-phosphate decarboxylase [Methylophaga lonarensis MPL]
MLNHGGQLLAHAQQHDIAPDDWLDLSTGINPNGWPVPESLPASVWSRLPDNADDLVEKAKVYYRCKQLLAVAGSQAAIQCLPSLRSSSRVAIVAPAYEEHRHCWQQAGHQVVELHSHELDQHIDQFDVVIVINPNNPTGETFSAERLLSWHRQLHARRGWLIVDEAFIDMTPEQSLAGLAAQRGLIVLRSLGKFFGLAGLRLGFVMAHSELLSQLEEKLGPWPIASASRWLAVQALADHHWQRQARQQLPDKSQRLAQLLEAHQLHPAGGCALFQWVKTGQAAKIHHQLASHGILCRLFDKPQAVRFGLPAIETDWQRLQNALNKITRS